MSVKFSNNATTELASSIGTSDTSITVVDASKFPILTAGDYTYVTLDTDTASPTREIVRVTAISGNVLTVTRGQDGTSPASFAAGTKVELRLTAALLNDVAGANPSGEPIGFPDKSQTTITFDSGTRTFSITPTGASFDVYCKGVKYTYTTVQLVTIPNTTGLHFIYFSASGVLSTQMSYFTWEEHAPTAYIYWNASTQQAVYFGDERHGITLDWQTHEYLHRTRGAAIASGFAASGYTTTGLGATDADAQIDVAGGTFFDEDMQVDIVSTNTPVAGTWQQDLSGPARIPVMYLSGAAWVIDSPTNFPFKVISSVPQYNLLSGSTWSTAGVTNNSYFVSWILATNNLTYPVISIISQAPTNQLSVAEAMTFEGLNLNGFPSVEFRPLYKVIYQYKDGFANSVKSSTVAVYDLRSISSAGVAAALVQDHGNLSGLTDDDHPQYVHTSEVRTPSAAVKNSFFPSQVGQTGKYLSTDGTNPVWEPAPSGSLSFTGDVTGTGSTGSSVSLTLAASGVVAGQYTKVTVDAKGRVTAGTDITGSDVTTALGYTPYNATNPAGYTTNVGTVTSVSGTGTVSGLTLTGSVTSSGSLTLGGTLSLTSGQVTTALGFTPYNATNPSGYITGITSGMVTTALGYTPYNSSNPSGYTNNTGTVTSVSGTGTVSGLTLTGTVTGSGSLTLGGTLSLTSGQVTTALGYTPPQPTGTGASGTWAINITGGAERLSALGNYVLNASTNGRDFNDGIQAGFVDSGTNGYPQYGSIVRIKTYPNDGGAAELYFPYGASYGGSAMRYRLGQYNNAGWTSWKTVLDDSNYSSYALPLSGGTISGTVSINGGSSQPLNLTTSSSGPWGFGLTRSDANVSSKIFLHNGSGSWAWVYEHNPVFYNGGAYSQFLNSSNYSSYALPLSGGTLTGDVGVGSGFTGFNSISGTERTLYIANGNVASLYLHATGGSGRKYALFAGASGGLSIYDATGNATRFSLDTSSANFSVALQQGGNQVLHAGNYTSYSPSLTGSGASGTWSINVTGNAASASYATYLPPLYAGGQQLNPQTYFNINTGLKVAMTAVAGYWSDTVWINGYAGGDVLSMCALHTSRQGTPRMWITTQASNASSYGTLYEFLSTYNYTSYSPSLTGSGASGTWGISISGSAAQLNGYSSAENGASVVLRTASSGYLYLNNWIHVASGGLFSSVNGSHWRPSAQSFGSWEIIGSRGGYTGIACNGTSHILNWMVDMNGNLQGFYNQSYGWQMYWSGGSLTVFKNSYGGGTAATVLDSANYTSYAPSLTGSGASGSWSITAARATRANGNLYIDDNYGNGIVGVYSSYRYQGVFAMGDSYKLPADGTTTGSLYGMAWSHPNAGGAAGNLDSHGMLVLINGGFGSCMSYSIKASGNVTAYSDERLKTNWRPMPTNYVERLASVKVGIYDRTDGEQMTQVGVSAQSFQELLPEAITKAGDEMGTLSVSYGNAALASAVELAKELVMLKRELAEIKSRLH